MKKIQNRAFMFACVLMAAATTSLRAADVHPTPTLVNPSFEDAGDTGDKAAGWGRWGEWFNREDG